MPRSAAYVIGFAAAVCVVCAIFVSTAAVLLQDEQVLNRARYRQENVLVAAGLKEPGESVPTAEIERLFERVDPVVIDLRTGEPTEADPREFDQQRAARDPSTSRPAPPNRAQIQRVPNHALVYEMRDEQGELDMVILPVEGKGLWSTMYGFLALDSDLVTIRGITFYQHGETPGLGGEVENPRWMNLWPGRKAFGEEQQVAITVVKGPAGPVEEDPYRVDGLSGATLTSRGVTYMLEFWLGEEGFGPYLERLRAERGS